jgi:hypothetical protein
VVLKGGETIRRYRDSNTASGGVLIRSFCPQCGSNLFLDSDGHESEYKMVTTGSVDGNIDWGMFRFSDFGDALANTLCSSTTNRTFSGSQEAMGNRDNCQTGV